MTRARMYLRMITRAFVRRISRVLIASLSIIVGATTLSALAIITYTVPDQIARELRSYGANLVVSPSSTQTVRVDDMVALNAALADAGVQVVGHAPYRQDNLLYNQQPLSAMGTDLAWPPRCGPTGASTGNCRRRPARCWSGATWCSATASRSGTPDGRRPGRAGRRLAAGHAEGVRAPAHRWPRGRDDRPRAGRPGVDPALGRPARHDRVLAARRRDGARDGRQR